MSNFLLFSSRKYATFQFLQENWEKERNRDSIESWCTQNASTTKESDQEFKKLGAMHKSARVVVGWARIAVEVKLSHTL